MDGLQPSLTQPALITRWEKYFGIFKTFSPTGRFWGHRLQSAWSWWIFWKKSVVINHSLKLIQFVKIFSNKGADCKLGSVEYTKCNIKITLTRFLFTPLFVFFNSSSHPLVRFFVVENMSSSQAILPLLHPALPPLQPHPIRLLSLPLHPPHHGGGYQVESLSW